MRFQIKHLLLLTTAWSVLITATYLNAGLAQVLATVGVFLLIALVPLTLIVFVVAAFRQKSHSGGLDRVIVRLVGTILVVGIVVVVSGFMFARHFGH